LVLRSSPLPPLGDSHINQMRFYPYGK
jgi:hypothetical protein